MEKKVIKENLRLHKKEAESYERDKSEIYNKREQRRIRNVLNKARKHLKTQSTELRALDIGCGTGNILKKLDLHFDEIIGIDLSKEMLSVALEGVEIEEKPKLIRGRAAILPFPDESFDLVSAYSVLHHLPSFSRPLSEIARVLKKGGILYIDHEPVERRNPLVKLYIKFCDILNGGSSPGLPPYKDMDGREYCDYHLHHGKEVGIPINRVLKLCSKNGITPIREKKYLAFGTDKNFLYPIFKHFISTEWLFIGRKEFN